MSIESRMKNITLQKINVMHSNTGAQKQVYEDLGMIRVAISKTNSTSFTNSLKYQESTHVGLTRYLGLDEDEKYRLVDGEKIYDITSITPGRYTNLLLKRIDIGE